MNPRITLVLVIVLVALGGYIYFFESPVDEDETNRPLGSLYGHEYGEYDIVEFRIAGQHGIAQFARTGDTLTRDWEMLQPNPLPFDQVDQVRVNGAATRLGRLAASQVITGVANLAQYGLEPPDMTVTLTISDGQKIMLHTGAETPVQNNRYLRIAADNQSVYLVHGFVAEDLHRLLDEPPLKPTVSPAVVSP